MPSPGYAKFHYNGRPVIVPGKLCRFVAPLLSPIAQDARALVGNLLLFWRIPMQ